MIEIPGVGGRGQSVAPAILFVEHSQRKLRNGIDFVVDDCCVGHPRADGAIPGLAQPVDQFLQTLLIATSYMSGQISPNLTLAYDWSGAWLVQPQVTFSRDPFRFTFAYSFLDARHLKGASGISLLRDRDNVLFQFEYVI